MANVSRFSISKSIISSLVSGLVSCIITSNESCSNQMFSYEILLSGVNIPKSYSSFIIHCSISLGPNSAKCTFIPGYFILNLCKRGATDTIAVIGGNAI